MRKIKLIVNMESGKVRSYIPALNKLTLRKIASLYQHMEKDVMLRKILLACRKYKLKVDVFMTAKPGDATEEAKRCVKEKYDTVMVAGGDGTINEVLNGLAGSSTKLGLIPAGSANVLGLQLGIHSTIEQAVSIIAKGHWDTYDLGRANGRYFVLMAGIGFDAFIIKKLHPGWKKFMGAFSYPFAAIIALFTYKFHRLKVTIGNKTIPCYYAIIANASYYAGEISLAGKSDMQDGLLNIAVFRNKHWYHLLRYFVGATFGKLSTYMDVEFYTAKSVHVRSFPKVLTQVDGELHSKTPLHVRVVPKSLRLLIPRRKT